MFQKSFWTSYDNSAVYPSLPAAMAITESNAGKNDIKNHCPLPPATVS